MKSSGWRVTSCLKCDHPPLSESQLSWACLLLSTPKELAFWKAACLPSLTASALVQRTIGMVGRGAAASALGRLPVCLLFPQVLTGLCLPQACVPVAGKPNRKSHWWAANSGWGGLYSAAHSEGSSILSHCLLDSQQVLTHFESTVCQVL